MLPLCLFYFKSYLILFSLFLFYYLGLESSVWLALCLFMGFIWFSMLCGLCKSISFCY